VIILPGVVVKWRDFGAGYTGRAYLAISLAYFAMCVTLIQYSELVAGIVGACALHIVV